MNTFFVKPLFRGESERAVRLYGTTRQRQTLDTISYPNYRDLRDRTRTLAGLAAHQYATLSLATGTETRMVQGEVVTGNYFQTLNISPLHGRLLGPQDDVSIGGHPVAVVSQRFAATTFGEPQAALGATIRLNGYSFDVIGVTRPDFHGSYGAFISDMWLPMAMYEQARPRGLDIERRGWGWLSMTGRLAQDTTFQQAQAELSTLSAQMAGSGGVLEDFDVALRRAGFLPDQIRSMATGLLAFFAVIGGLVLLIACANVAGLFVASLASRRLELAVRLSLGAGRARLGQLIAESLSLAFLGGLVGLLMTLWTGDVARALQPPSLAGSIPEATVDVTVMAFAAAVAVVVAAGLIASYLPARWAVRIDPLTAIRHD